MADTTPAQAAPALKSFAPSRDDVLSTLAYFFGQPVSPEKLKNYDEHHAMTYHFPDAYYGQNTKIRETINNLILRSPQTWQTTVGLPFVKIEGTVVEWDEIRFDVRLLQRVPYEGVSRMQTSLKRRHRDRVVRRGMGLTIESDFYATEAGRAHFTNELTSIRYCVQETCNFDALFAYLTCGNYDFRYDMAKGLRPRRSVRTALQHEIAMYAIAQKEGMGLDKAVEDCKYRMSRYGVQPNMLVIPPQLALYMSLAPEEKTRYDVGGPKADAIFEAGKAGFEGRPFRGCNVVTSEPFEVADDQDSVQLLNRSTQVGEFYIMSPPHTAPQTGATGFMDILIYDEERDLHVRITWADAVEACCTKELANNALVDDGKGGTLTTDAWKEAADAWNNQNNDGYGTKTPPPTQRVSIMICRPFIEHLMSSAILTVGGRDTGATLFGPADMQISANTSVKTIEGHYTCHTKAVITKPQNVYVMRDISCNGYVAGCNTKWFAKKDGKFSVDNVRQNMADRLAFAEGEDSFGSMLAFPMMGDGFEQHDQVVSISNRLMPWEVQKKDDNGFDVKKYFPGGSTAWNVYKKAYNLPAIHFGEDIKAAQGQEFISQGSTNNALCFMGPHRKFNSFSASAYELMPGQGHFGPDAIPGDARWRRGESVSLKTARDSMISLEVAAHSQMVFNKR